MKSIYIITRILLVFVLLMVSLFYIDKISVSHYILIKILVVLAYLIAVLLISKFTIKEYFKFDFNLKPTNFLIIFIGSLGIFLFNSSALILFNTFDFEYKISTFQIISALLIAPIIEEFLFRKVIAKKLTENFSHLFSILVSSFLFTLIHVFHGIGLLFIFFGGIFFGHIYLKTKNIIYSIYAHSLNNIFILLLFPFLFKIDSSFKHQENIIFGSLLIFGLFLLIFFIYKLNHVIKITPNTQTDNEE